MHPVEKQTILVTGVTDGLGRALAGRLAELGATVLAHGRNPDKLAETCREIGEPARPVLGDLARLADVDRLADAVLAEAPQLHSLVNNAGVGFGPPDGQRQVSADGVELRFAVNHLASYRLARRLAPRLVESAPARIVQVASAGQLAIDFADPQTERDYDGVTAYRRAKLAQVMATFALADELAGTGVTVNALHPATFMDTTMVREHGQRPVSTVEEGLRATLRLVVDPDLDDVTGRYFEGTREGRADPQAHDRAARDRVLALTDELIERFT